MTLLVLVPLSFHLPFLSHLLFTQHPEIEIGFKMFHPLKVTGLTSVWPDIRIAENGMNIVYRM